MNEICILIGDNYHIDFREPVEMDEEQYRKFIAFMKKQFKVIEPINTQKLRSERLGSKLFVSKWSDDELSVLLQMEDTNKISEFLGRSWMSVDIRRGEEWQNWQAWLSKNNIDPSKEDIKLLIERYLKEQGKNKSKRKEDRKKLNEKIKELERLNAREKELNTLYVLKKVSKRDIDNFIENKNKLIKEIEELK